MITLNELENLIKKDYPTEYKEIIEGLNERRNTSFRVNNNLSNRDEVIKYLDDNSIKYNNPSFYSDSFILEDKIDLSASDLFKDGKIYLQSLSSQIPPLFLDLNDSSDILDMCAAPGGKTSMIASLTKNTKNILALESNKIRFERLKYNLKLQNAKANVMLQDSRKLDDFFRFDTILLDAPCSGSGTLNLNNPNSLKNFSTTLVSNSVKSQKELLKKALTILKKGHTMIYSTCSILKCENEEVLKSVLSNEYKIEEINLDIDKTNLLPSCIKGVITVKPSKDYEGFFIAKIKKI